MMRVGSAGTVSHQPSFEELLSDIAPRAILKLRPVLIFKLPVRGVDINTSPACQKNKVRGTVIPVPRFIPEPVQYFKGLGKGSGLRKMRRRMLHEILKSLVIRYVGDGCVVRSVPAAVMGSGRKHMEGNGAQQSRKAEQENQMFCFSHCISPGRRVSCGISSMSVPDQKTSDGQCSAARDQFGTHVTPAYSQAVQSCTPRPAWPHSSSVFSVPSHPTSSSR